MVIRKRNDYEDCSYQDDAIRCTGKANRDYQNFNSPVLYGARFSLLLEKGPRARIFIVSPTSLKAFSAAGESWAQTIRYIVTGF